MQVFPFFTGCQRSGTTLIKEIFRTHSQLAIPPESQFIPELLRRRARYETAAGFAVEAFIGDLVRHERFGSWKLSESKLKTEFRAPAPADIADAIRRVYALFAERFGKPMYGDKTPRYATAIPLLADAFPEARFVHAIRDGRDVALSLRDAPWGPTRTERAALYWAERVRAARDAGDALGPGRYLEYRYEDLLDDPAAVVRRICSFLDLGFEEAMLSYHESLKPRKAPHFQHIHKPPTKGLRDWRGSMSPSNLRVFEILAGDVLGELGYEPATDHSTLSLRNERAAQALARRTRLRFRIKAAQDSDRFGPRIAARAAASTYAGLVRLRDGIVGLRH